MNEVVQGSRKRTEKGPIRQRPLSRGSSRIESAPPTLELRGAPDDFAILNGILEKEANKEVHIVQGGASIEPKFSILRKK